MLYIYFSSILFAFKMSITQTSSRGLNSLIRIFRGKKLWNLHGLIRMLKSKMTSVRVVELPFRLFSRNIWQNIRCVVLELVPLRGVKKIFKPHPSIKILVPFRAFLENFQQAPHHFYMGVPLPRVFGF